MTTTKSSSMGGWAGIAAFLAIVLGAMIIIYGLAIVQDSFLGGVHIALIGLSMLLSGVFVSEWVGHRLGLAPVTQRRLVFGFVATTAVLILVFIGLNFASFGTFESGGSTSGGSSSN